MLPLTLMTRFALVVRAPSETWSTMVLLPMAAAQLAVILAFIVPPLFVTLEIVRPEGTVGAVTVRLPGLLCASFTVAMVELEAAVPCCRDKPAAGVMEGAVFG